MLFFHYGLPPYIYCCRFLDIRAGGLACCSEDSGEASWHTALANGWCCSLLHQMSCVAAAPLCAADLKPSLSRALNAILEPVRQHFANNKEAAALLKQVRSYKVTR
jgi:hypothetical protein